MCVPLWDVSFNHFLLTSSSSSGLPLERSWQVTSAACMILFSHWLNSCTKRSSKGTDSIFDIFFPPVRDLIPSPQGFFLGTFLPRDCCFSVRDESWGWPSLRASVHFFSLQSSGNTWKCSLHGPMGPCLRGEGMQSEAGTRIYTENLSISSSVNRSGYPSKPV